MTTSPFAPVPAWQRVLRSLALPVSVVLHVGLAWIVIQEREEEPEQEEVWVEMVVTETPEPPPPEPEPEPEPKPEPKPEPVEFKDTVKEPPPEPPPDDRPPERNKKLRVVQGLSAESFAEGAGTDLSMRAGTTLQVAATDETLSIDEAADSTAIPYTAATTQPRLKTRPPLEVPDTIKEEGIEGSVKVVLDIGADGSVTAVRVTSSLTPEADDACVTSWMKAKFRPGKQGDTAVPVLNFPRRCRFQAIE